MLYADLSSEVLPETPGCPDFTVLRAIRDSAIEFFDATMAYTVDQDPEQLYAGLDVVDLAIPTGTRLVQLLRAQVGARPLARLSRDQLLGSQTNWRSDVGEPVAVVFEGETSVRLLPIPDREMADPLYLRFAVTPSRTSTSISNAIGERYYREIAAGVKSRLMLMPDKSWSNDKMGVGYRAMYERMIREAKLTVAQDQITAEKQVRLRRVV